MYEPMSDSGEPLEQTTEAPAPPPHPWRGLQQGRNSVTKKWGRIALDTDDVVESKRKSALIDEPGYVNIITSPLTESVDLRRTGSITVERPSRKDLDTSLKDSLEGRTDDYDDPEPGGATKRPSASSSAVLPSSADVLQKEIQTLIHNLDQSQLKSLVTMLLKQEPSQLDAAKAFVDMAKKLRVRFDKKDWNADFQQLLSMPDSESKFRKLFHLAHDFVYCSSTYAKIIISELLLPDDEKTIKPAEVGGVAGGSKFIVQNILFKFVLDFELKPGCWMYGGDSRSDENAMKAAAHELKGLMSYYSCNIPGLCFPLMALIDYKGFRVIAISILPIQNGSIIYGSSNAGRNVHRDEPEVNDKMDKAAAILNLKKHKVNRDIALSSPGDLEVHRGSDSLYYLLDFARVFPPEGPDIDPAYREKRQVYYKLLRPEYVRKWKKPLCSDAFTNWQRYDSERNENNYEVILATHELHNVHIPEFVKGLDSTFSNNTSTPEKDAFQQARAAFAKKFMQVVKKRFEGQEGAKALAVEVDGATGNPASPETPKLPNSDDNEIIKLTEAMHRAGINLRHLGLVRNRVKSYRIRQLLLTEMIARVIKDVLRTQLRAKMREVRVLSEEPFKEVVVKIFSFVLGRHRHSIDFWNMVRNKIISKFKCSLSKEEEQDDAIYLPQKIEIGVLFKRLEALLGVQLTDEARSELENFSESFEFVHSDIKEIYPKVKHMNIVDYAEGMALYLAAIRRKEAGERERLRQLRLSSAKFARAISTLPDSYLTLYQWGLVIAEEAKMTSTLNAQKLFQEAIEKLKSALDINEAFQGCWIKLGEIQLEVAKLAPSTSNSTRSGSSIEKKKSMPTIQSAKSLYLAAASSFNRALTIDDYFIEEVYKKMQGLHTAATSQRNVKRKRSRHMHFGVMMLCKVLHEQICMSKDNIIRNVRVAPNGDTSDPSQSSIKENQPISADEVVARLDAVAREQIKNEQILKSLMLPPVSGPGHRRTSSVTSPTTSSGTQSPAGHNYAAGLDDELSAMSVGAPGSGGTSTSPTSRITLSSAPATTSSVPSIRAPIIALAASEELSPRDAQLQMPGPGLRKSMFPFSSNLNPHSLTMSSAPATPATTAAPIPIGPIPHRIALAGLIIAVPNTGSLPELSPVAVPIRSATPPNSSTSDTVFRTRSWTTGSSLTRSASRTSMAPSVLSQATKYDLPTPGEASTPTSARSRRGPASGYDDGASASSQAQGIASPSSSGRNSLRSSREIYYGTESVEGPDMRNMLKASGSIDQAAPPPAAPGMLRPPPTRPNMLRLNLPLVTTTSPSYSPSSTPRLNESSWFFKPKYEGLSEDDQNKLNYLQSIHSDVLFIWADSIIQYAAAKKNETLCESLFAEAADKATLVLAIDPLHVVELSRRVRTLEEQARENRRLYYAVASLYSVIYPIKSICDVLYKWGMAYLNYAKLFTHDNVKFASLHREAGEKFQRALELQPSFFDYQIMDILRTQCSDIEWLLRVTLYCKPLQMRASSLAADVRTMTLKGFSTVTDAMIDVLCRFCPAIEYLDLTDCVKVSNDGILALADPPATRLRTLNLTRITRVTDPAIQQLCEACPDLTELILDDCTGLADASVQVIAANLKNLRKLSLDRCKITVEAAIHIASHPPQHIEELSFNGCIKIEDEGIQAIAAANLSTMRILSLNGCSVLTDASVEAVAQSMPNLRAIHLQSLYRITDASVKALIRYISQLEVLDVRNCKSISWEGMLEAFTLPPEATHPSHAPLAIRHLDLGRIGQKSKDMSSSTSSINKEDEEIELVRVKSELFQLLAWRLGNTLEVLRINESDAPDSSLRDVADSLAGHLKEINLSECGQLSNKTLSAIASASPQLERLAINSCRNITVEGSILGLAESCKKMLKLELARVVIPDEGIRALAQNMTRLTKIVLAGNYFITDQALLFMSSHLPHLRHVNLANCSKISDIGAIGLVQSLKDLRYLNMDSSRVTNKTLFVLAQLSAQLKHLTLARCASVSDTGVIAVAEGTPVLRSLDLTSVERISDQSVLALIRFQPQLEALGLKNCSKITERSLSQLSLKTNIRIVVEPSHNLLLMKELSVKSKISLRRRPEALPDLVAVESSPKKEHKFSLATPELINKFKTIGRRHNSYEDAVLNALVQSQSAPDMSASVGPQSNGMASSASFGSLSSSPVLPAFEPFDTKMTYQDIVSRDKSVIALDPQNLEKYLHEDEFQQIFKLKPEEFDRLPVWKKRQAKIEVKLF